LTFEIGEGFAGEGVDAAHVNTVLGARDGPVGVAWATALASPSAGHTPFVVVLQPNLPVRPTTLFVNKATIADDAHGRLTWGAAQAGLAAGVVDAVRRGVVDEDAAADLLLIAAVWVNTDAQHAEAVYANNRIATLAAITAGRGGRPSVRDVLDASEPSNPYFRAPVAPSSE
jgi:5,6,7,8-tetrahydromethanopterin hydro-lyase